MFPIVDGLDVVLLGTFLFGLLFTIGSLFLGAVDIGGDHGADHGGDSISITHLYNLNSLLAFVTWFGGFGYLTRNGLGAPWFIAIVVGVIGGVLAAYLVSTFIRKVLRAGDDTLDPSRYERVGVLAKVTSSIFPGGVGEIVWEQEGSRMVTSARAEEGVPIPRGTEVVILRVEKGVAIVVPFEALMDTSGATIQP